MADLSTPTDAHININEIQAYNSSHACYQMKNLTKVYSLRTGHSVTGETLLNISVRNNIVVHVTNEIYCRSVHYLTTVQIPNH